MFRVLLAVGIIASAFAQNATPPVPIQDLDDSSSELRPLIDRYVADRGSLLRFYSIDASPARRERIRRFVAEWSGRLAAQNFQNLSRDAQIDAVLFRNHLEHERRRLDIDAKTREEIAPLLPFSATIVNLEETRRTLAPIKQQEAAATLAKLTRDIDGARRAVESRLRNSPNGETTRDRRILASRAASAATALRTTLRNWFNYYNGYDPLFTWWADAPFKSADASLQSYIGFLRERVAGLRAPSTEPAQASPPPAGQQRQTPPPATTPRPGESADIVGNPIGREALLSELAFEMIPYTPEELIDIANKEFAWCENEMKKASNELGFGDDWKKALEHVKTLHVEPGKQPELIRDLAREAEKFLDDHDLVTIPALARETWRMEMMSPERQLVSPFFLGGETILVSYPTNTMSHEQKLMSMRGNNIHFSRATVFHELIPGHELQGFMAARYRPYRALFGTPFFGEGWSLYWELLLWDMKFQKTPEDRVGALFWRMHRCARIIFSLGFHMGNMTPDECIDFLVNRVGHERENATGEVRRSFGGAYGPLYQVAYLLGGIQLHKLHKELVDSGKMTNRQFHDTILRQNRIPVEMIRAALTNQALTADYTTQWRFYE
jgi:uncharacterized protein (DUF885 family)